MRLLPLFATLRQDLFDHRAINIGEPEVAAEMSRSQSGVIDPEQVEHRGVQIVNVNLALDDLEAHVVGFTGAIAPSAKNFSVPTCVTFLSSGESMA